MKRILFSKIGLIALFLCMMNFDNLFAQPSCSSVLTADSSFTEKIFLDAAKNQALNEIQSLVSVGGWIPRIVDASIVDSFKSSSASFALVKVIIENPHKHSFLEKLYVVRTSPRDSGLVVTPRSKVSREELILEAARLEAEDSINSKNWPGKKPQLIDVTIVDHVENSFRIVFLVKVIVEGDRFKQETWQYTVMINKLDKAPANSNPENQVEQSVFKRHQ